MVSHNSGNRGFTIVEMAVVVFVIGLIIAGITAGKSVLSGAKTRAIITEMDENRDAMQLFREKYFDWPGDIDNATTIWESASTDDGDGDERIEWDSGEGSLAWNHLMLAQMIGQTGFPASKTVVAVIGSTVPSSKIAGGGWFVDYNDTMENHIGLGAAQSGGGVNDGGVVPASRAADIDLKLDDGDPVNGRIQSDTAAGCSNGTEYDVGESTPSCVMRFSLD